MCKQTQTRNKMSINYLSSVIPKEASSLTFTMADNLLISFMAVLLVGLLFSTFTTFRDSRALRRISHGLYRWQIALVVIDAVQNAFISFNIGIVAFMISKNQQLSWIEAIISWTLQCMFCTNVRSPT
jgi:hypothetical protein